MRVLGELQKMDQRLRALREGLSPASLSPSLPTAILAGIGDRGRGNVACQVTHPTWLITNRPGRHLRVTMRPPRRTRRGFGAEVGKRALVPEGGRC